MLTVVITDMEEKLKNDPEIKMCDDLKLLLEEMEVKACLIADKYHANRNQAMRIVARAALDAEYAKDYSKMRIERRNHV